ncbi:MAG: hypothetical protein AB8C13_00385 [Phycisphaerales bacterium]
MKLDARRTNRTSYRTLLIAGLAIGTLGSSAMAQPVPQNAQPQRGVDRVESLPTTTPYPKLISKDENGKVVRLSELPDILALRSNPTIGQKSVQAIMPVLYGRRARFERITIDNLDLYWLATDGRVDTMDLQDIQNMASIAEMIKPLVGRTTLSQELRNRGILTRTQAGMNEHIVNEYKQAVTNEIQFDAEDPLSEIMRFVLEDSIHETRQAYRAMIAELTSQVGDLIGELGFTSTAAMELAKLQSPLETEPEVQLEQQRAMNAAIRKLSVDEGIELLTLMRTKRKNPDISPAVKVVNVMHSRKVDISDKDTMQGFITTKDGRVIDTRKNREANNEKLRKQQEELEAQKEGKEVENSDD